MRIMSIDAHFVSATKAVHAGDDDGVRALLTDHPELAAHRPAVGGTLLQVAAWNLLDGDFSRGPRLLPDANSARAETARLLLAAGADHAVVDEYRWTPLHSAAYAGAAAFCQALIDGGADASARGWEDSRPIDPALFWGHRDAAAVLAAADETPLNLRTAAAVGDTDRVRELLGEADALDPAAGRNRTCYRPHDGLTVWTPSDARQEILDEALTYACRAGSVGSLEALISAGADVNGGPYLGTGLLWAANRGRLPVVDWLLDHGADIDLLGPLGGRTGMTPMHAAAWEAHPEVVRRLIERGANLVVHDVEFHSTPLGWALFREDAQIASLLLDAGCEKHLLYAVTGGRVDDAKRLLAADPSCVNEDHGVRTPLHVAASRGDLEMCALLLRHGADLSRTDEGGNTPLELATMARQDAVVRVLQTAGA